VPTPPDPAPVIELAGEALWLDDLLPGERAALACVRGSWRAMRVDQR
jgi:hypothetical protein